jgi:hypothetical protein
MRRKYPQFQFMAEVCWDSEWVLQHQGFDYCYDKRLYDRLRAGHVRPVREHLLGDLIVRTSWSASWKATMNHAQRPRSQRPQIAPPLLQRFSRRA